MEKLDTLVLQVVVVSRVFTPGRVELMIKELRRNLKHFRSDHYETLKKLDTLKDQTDRLYEAVEKGPLPLDGALQERLHRNQARRQKILTEMAGLRRQKGHPLAQFDKKHVSAFCAAIEKRLMDRGAERDSSFCQAILIISAPFPNP